MEIFKQENSTGALSLSWFREKGFLGLLMQNFGGDTSKAIASAVAPATEQHAEVSSKAVPKGDKPFYTEDDLAQDLGVPRSKARKILRDIGLLGKGAPTGSYGRSGFSKKAVESRKIRMTYEQYLLAKNQFKNKGKPREGS